jgi:glyoxylase-like metal-dependent hydrolase (beta-lactamase superfamily II)/rhodanese-related sulfurtransferase
MKSRRLLAACIAAVASVNLSAQTIDPTIVQGDAYVVEANKVIRNIDTVTLKSMIDEVPGLVFIDVREAAEIAQTGGTIDAPRMYNVSRGWLEFRVPERVPDKETPIVTFCGLNMRSPLAALDLMNMGYTNVVNYEDGFPAWVEAGLPVTVDTSPGNLLYTAPIQVTEIVWSAIGATAPPTYENSGHNNNLSFIITTEGVVVVNAGDNALLAESLHHEIRALTDQPVKYVILENGQGHAMLGSNYWQSQGAEIVAHVDTLHEIEENGPDILGRMQSGRRDKSFGTVLTTPDITFEEKWIVELGGEQIEARYLGPAHSPGDISVWLPNQQLVIAGDVAFHERMLPVTEHTDTAGWIETWESFLELGAEIVIPGHGGPTNYAEVTRYTRDYLIYMREKVAALVEAGGALQDAYLIDQSQFSHLDTYFELKRQNAGTIFREMEFDF